VPLPWDESHTAYVWADAFLNYLTGLGWDGETPLLTKEGAKGGVDLWPADVHLMSKDILRVHATIWPAMLLSLELPLPKALFVHGFFLIDGQEMSKSLGNVITPQDLVKRYGVDGARYLLMSAAPFGADGDISWEKFDEKYNADLANGLGNLVARSVTLVEKMQNAKIKMQNDNSKLKIKQSWSKYQDALKYFKIDGAVGIINNEIKYLDSYITEEKPWELIKNKDERVGVVMYNILERLRHIAWMVWPFMPDTAEKIWESLGLEPQEEMRKDFEEAIKWGGLSVDAKVKKSEALFPRL
jgi:methionyl-tRNA synthetase